MSEKYIKFSRELLDDPALFDIFSCRGGSYRFIVLLEILTKSLDYNFTVPSDIKRLSRMIFRHTTNDRKTLAFIVEEGLKKGIFKKIDEENLSTQWLVERGYCDDVE